MQSLHVVSRLFPDILNGRKTATIRWNEQRIVAGPMRYISEASSEVAVVVNVTQCTDMPLRDAAGYLGKLAEWPDEVMLSGMREHYPDITLNDTVQVIEHDPPDPELNTS